MHAPPAKACKGCALRHTLPQASMEMIEAASLAGHTSSAKQWHGGSPAIRDIQTGRKAATPRIDRPYKKPAIRSALPARPTFV